MNLVDIDANPVPSERESTESLATPAIEVHDVSHSFRRGTSVVRVLDNVSLGFKRGEITSLVGPSGCGKTTLLNMIAGEIRPSQGDVSVEGVPCAKPTPSIGYMYAKDCLLPWRTAAANVELPLEIRGVQRGARRLQARELLELVGLGEFLHSFPRELSHGMRQRVAVARTLACEPQVFLMDEPFAALDAQTRLRIESEFVTLCERLELTVVCVTHDIAEAVAISDRVVVMSARPGRVVLDQRVELGRPRDIRSARFEPEFTRLSKMLWDSLEEPPE